MERANASSRHLYDEHSSAEELDEQHGTGFQITKEFVYYEPACSQNETDLLAIGGRKY